MAIAQETASYLSHLWETLRPEFGNFHDARNQDGLWKQIKQGKVIPDIHPDLKKYAMGLQYMSGKLREDFRILKILHSANPTYMNASTRGSTQAARNAERDRKLVWAGWWDQTLNRGRNLDSEVYEAQIGLGAWVGRLRWKQCMNEDGTSDCPVSIEKVILDAMVWQGDFRDPSVALCRYSVSMLDCGIKNSKGERPYYTDGEAIGWTSEMLPTDAYKYNAGKKVDIIVMDAVDPVAMCPVEGCHHRQRRITVYICKAGGEPSDYEEIESYDSPFARCSFIIVGGDVNHTERDPHEILRPSAWILTQLVLEYNMLFNSLLATFAREVSQDQRYVNAGSTSADTFNALAGKEDLGQSNTIELPEAGSSEAKALPGPVLMLPQPSTQTLMALLDKKEKEYDLYRPNRNLTGNASVSEVTGTAAVLQTQGAGMVLAEDLINWDDGHERIHEDTMHGIRFTSHFEPDDEQTRYISVVSGRENVKGARGAAPGDVLYLDGKKCAIPVKFTAETSKDTPADRRDREERARTAKAAGIFVQRDVDEAYGIFDPDMQEELRFAESVEQFLKPLELRRVAALVAARSASITGTDMGEEPLVSQLPLPGEDGPQSYNTSEANAARRHTPPVEVPSTGNIGAGGSSGLG